MEDLGQEPLKDEAWMDGSGPAADIGEESDEATR